VKWGGGEESIEGGKRGRDEKETIIKGPEV
jgi:hypothetical protein